MQGIQVPKTCTFNLVPSAAVLPSRARVCFFVKSRFQAATQMVDCQTYELCFESTSLSLMNNCLNGGTHGPVHIMVGGEWNDPEENFITKIGAGFLHEHTMRCDPPQNGFIFLCACFTVRIRTAVPLTSVCWGGGRDAVPTAALVLVIIGCRVAHAPLLARSTCPPSSWEFHRNV